MQQQPSDRVLLPIALVCLFIGLLMAFKQFPSTWAHFGQYLYEGPSKASNPCGGGLELILWIPLMILSAASYLLAYGGTFAVMSVILLTSQIPVALAAAFVAWSKRSVVADQSAPASD